jgi:DNA-binding SARP family transcriptional activator/TolB-like protein
VPTFRLETFGKLTLSGGPSSDVSHQRRRLALLALLAASGERGLSRDQILGYLWSESAAGNARHALEQLLHTLRRALGESVFSGTNPVRLDSQVVASDVVEFESALARGSFAEAIALYHGPFLSGFYLDDAPEFERWMTGERARLATRYSEALERLASDAERAGDYSAAVRWRRLFVEADPISSRSALALMRALAAAGDRTAALQHARVYEALVRQELESEPDPSVAKYAATLRAGGDERAIGSAALLPVTKPAKTASTPLQGAPVVDGAVKKAAVEKVPVENRVESVPAGRRTSRWSAGIFLGAIILVVAVLWARSHEKPSTLDANKMVVVPFRTSAADSSLKYLGEGVVDLITPMLTGEGGPIAVDSRTAISTWNRTTKGREGTAEDARRVARELGAGVVLSGAVVGVGGKLTITGSVISASTGDTRPLTSVSGPVDSVYTLLDQFVGQILARQSGVAETSIAAVTSQSLPAVRAYLTGRAAYRRADENGAIDNFSRALDIDSTFALAALDLAVATGTVLRAQICRNKGCRVFSIVPGFASSDRTDDLFDRAVRLAWQYRVKLGKRDRPLLDALRGENYPRASSARETLVGLERAMSAASDRPETHYLLGVLLLYQGPALGIADSRARAEVAFRNASRLDSSYLAPLAHLVDVAALDGDTARLRRSGVVYLARDNFSPAADYVRWLVAVGTADSAAADAVRARFRSLSSPMLDRIFLTSQMTGLGVDDADSAAAIIIDNATGPIEKSIALRRRQMLATNRGRPADATRWLRRMNELRTPSYTFRTMALDVATFDNGDRSLGDSSARDLARSFERDTLGSLTPEVVRQISAPMSIVSSWYLETGDTSRAKAAAGWLGRHLGGQRRNRVLSVLPDMLIASRARRPEGAALRAYVDSVALDGCCDFPPFGNLILAQAYEASGDAPSALRVIRRGIWYYPPRLLATQLREEGRLAEQTGDRAGALRAWEQYLALRSDPEAALRPERDSIRAEVSRLKRGR